MKRGRYSICKGAVNKWGEEAINLRKWSIKSKASNPNPPTKKDHLELF